MKYFEKIPIFLTILILFVFSPNIYTQSGGNANSELNITFYDNLCYKTTVYQHLRVNTALNLTTLTNFDKLKFVDRVLMENVHESIDNNGYYNIENTYIGNKNYFPKWYKVPEITLVNNNGTKLFYIEDNQHYEGGWPGHNRTVTKHGVYFEDPRTGERSLTKAYNTEEAADYAATNTLMNRYGVLYAKTFVFPDANQLQEYIRQGYTVTSTPTLIEVKNDFMEVVWDNVNKTMVIKTFSVLDGMTSKTTFIYEYITKLQEVVLVSVEEIIPGILSNGDCFDDVTLTLFSDYQLCGAAFMEIREKNEQTMMRELSLKPNPVENTLHVQLPDFDQKAKLELLSFEGKILIEQEIIQGRRKIDFDLSDFAAGIYIIRITKGDELFIEKFVKQ